jgi:hypothetical protein
MQFDSNKFDREFEGIRPGFTTLYGVYASPEFLDDTR